MSFGTNLLPVENRPPKAKTAYVYYDDGCNLFVSCLDCPLPRCQYDLSYREKIKIGLISANTVRRRRNGA